MSPRPRKEERHPDLQSAIKETAWQQITESGAAALNLRAIARSLNITAPSIYNYYPNRDALVTALIVDAFHSLAEAQEDALANSAADSPAARLYALGAAYREWAITHPQRYQLIFGTPIPHYHAPENITNPAATRSLIPLTTVVQDIYNAGELHTERLAPLTQKLEAMLTAWQKVTGHDPEVLYLTLVIWSRVHGLAGLEIGNQFPPFFDDPGEIFRRELNTILNQCL